MPLQQERHDFTETAQFTLLTNKKGYKLPYGALLYNTKTNPMAARPQNSYMYIPRTECLRKEDARRTSIFRGQSVEPVTDVAADVIWLHRKARGRRIKQGLNFVFHYTK